MVASRWVRAGHLVRGRKVMEDSAEVMEYIADVDAASEELGAGSLDVAHREVQALYRSRGAEVSPLPKTMAASDPGGVNWTTRKSSPDA